MAELHNADNVRRRGHVDVVPPKVLLAVYGVLLFLTIMTVKITDFDFGNFNVWVALFIVSGLGLVRLLPRLATGAPEGAGPIE